MRVNGIFQKIFQTGEMSVCDICVYATEGSSRYRINGFPREILYLDLSLFCDVSSFDLVGCAFIFPLRLMICCLSTGQDGTWIVSAVPPSVVRASCFLKYIRPLHPISSYYRSGHESPVQVLYTSHGYDFLLPWKHSRRFMFLIKNGSRVLVSSFWHSTRVAGLWRKTKKEEKENTSWKLFREYLLFFIKRVSSVSNYFSYSLFISSRRWWAKLIRLTWPYRQEPTTCSARASTTLHRVPWPVGKLVCK